MHLKEKLIWNIDYETNKYPSEIKKVLFKKLMTVGPRITAYIA